MNDSMSSNIVDFLEAQCSLNGEKIAVITPDEECTYNDLLREIRLCSNQLAQMQFKKNTLIPILCGNNKHFIVLLMAIWDIGAIPVPLNTRLSAGEIARLLEALSTGFLLLHEDIAFEPEAAQTILFPFVDNVTNAPARSHRMSQAPALIMFTSGTSGKAKGVMLSFDSLISSAKASNSVINYEDKDIWLASLPFYHIGGLSIIIRSIIFGTSVFIPDSLDQKGLTEALSYSGLTLLSLVPTVLKRLIDHSTAPPQKLRCTLLGGGPSSDDLMEISQAWKIVKVYGSTETASLVTALPSHMLPEKKASSGKAISGNRLSILDEKHNTLPAMHTGEIAISGPSIAMGYLNDAVETGKKFIDNTYLTGDIGYLDEDGYLFVLMRRTDLIVSGGENVNPLEVEAVMIQNPNILEVCVYGIDDDEWGQRVCASVVLKRNCNMSSQQIKDFLRKRIASYKIPKDIYLVSELPKNELGKISRQKMSPPSAE